MTTHKRLCGTESYQQNEGNKQKCSEESESESSDKSESKDNFINIGIPENVFDRIDLMYRH